MRIIFVCVENSNRSQMAEAFAKLYAIEGMKIYSAGSKPSGKINPKAIASMHEIGYDLSQHESKSIDEFRNFNFDYFITMGCGDQCPFIPAKNRMDWNIPDPRDMNESEFRKVREMIKNKVLDLLRKVEAENNTTS